MDLSTFVPSEFTPELVSLVEEYKFGAEHADKFTTALKELVFWVFVRDAVEKPVTAQFLSLHFRKNRKWAKDEPNMVPYAEVLWEGDSIDPTPRFEMGLKSGFGGKLITLHNKIRDECLN